MPLNSDAIKAALEVAVSNRIDSIAVFDSLDSTQQYIKRQPVGCRLCVAEHQTQGQGRRERRWLSSPGSDVLLSFSWCYERLPVDIAGLSLALVAEVAEVLVERYGLPVSIKWPNDLLLNGSKIAGFLVDIESGRSCRVIVGMGLNVDRRSVVDQSIEQLAAIDQPWADMAAGGVVGVDRNKLIAEVLTQWVSLLSTYADNGFAPSSVKWQRYAAFMRQRVVLRRQGVDELVASGVLEGIDEQGCLCVRQPSGELCKITDSELSLRLL